MTTDLVGFLDESKKPARDRATGKVSRTGDFYVVASVVTMEGDLERHRDQIAKLEVELGFKLHYGDLRTSARRVQAVEAITTIQGWEASVFESTKPIPAAGGGAEHRMRAKALEATFVDLGSDGGVGRVVLETRSQPSEGFHELDNKDHRVLQRLVTKALVPPSFTVSHATKSETLLSLADIVASSRTDMLCGKDDECYARLGHRVHKIRQVL